MMNHRFPNVRLCMMALWLTTTLGCESSTRVTTPSDDPIADSEARIISLEHSLEPLIERFNADRDKPRVLAIVSATCGACVSGALAVNEAVVTAYPSADISVLIIWIDILPSDTLVAASRVAGIFDDRRVQQFHDPNGLVGEAFAQGLLERPPAWDMYLIYAAAPRQLWADAPPAPKNWMHQLAGGVADPARQRSGHELVVGLYDAMSDLGFDPAIDAPPSEQTMARAKRATNAMVGAARQEEAADDASLTALAQCDQCAKLGLIGQCSLAGYRRIVAIPQLIDGDPPVLGFAISGTNNVDNAALLGDPLLRDIRGEVIVLDVEGMQCPDCPTRIVGSVLVQPGVKRVMVDYDAQEVQVTIDPPNSISREALVAAIEQSGFTATIREVE